MVTQKVYFSEQWGFEKYWPQQNIIEYATSTLCNAHIMADIFTLSVSTLILIWMHALPKRVGFRWGILFDIFYQYDG